MVIFACPFCGEEADPLSFSIFCGPSRCHKEICREKDKAVHDKIQKLLRIFAEEKYILLKPLKEKLDADLFLLKQEYMPYRKLEEDK
jgi:hypothetical protein